MLCHFKKNIAKNVFKLYYKNYLGYRDLGCRLLVFLVIDRVTSSHSSWQHIAKIRCLQDNTRSYSQTCTALLYLLFSYSLTAYSLNNLNSTLSNYNGWLILSRLTSNTNAEYRLSDNKCKPVDIQNDTPV